MQRELAEQTRQLEAERRALREEWVRRQRKRIAELEQRFADALAEHEREMARALEAVKDRELRAQIEKQSRRRIGRGARGGAQRGRCRRGGAPFGVAGGSGRRGGAARPACARGTRGRRAGARARLSCRRWCCGGATERAPRSRPGRCG